MNRKIKWGVLGYARIAKNQVIPAILKATNSEFYAIASRDVEKLNNCKELFNCEKLYGSYEELLNDPNVDAVYIPLPNHLHKEWTIKAALKGKHVLCEKPISLNLEECKEMVRVCKENNVKLMEAFMYRFTSKTKKVLELLQAGEIGEVRHINSSFRFLLNRPGDVRLNPEMGGGCLFDVGCYPLNFIGMITGRSPISMSAEYVMKEGIDVSFTAVLKYDNNIIAVANSGFDSYSLQDTLITGTIGVMHIPLTFSDTGDITLTTNDGTKVISVTPSERYVFEVEDFADSIIKDKEPSFSMEETIRNIEIISVLMKKINT